jgi:hypothetical protein
VSKFSSSSVISYIYETNNFIEPPSPSTNEECANDLFKIQGTTAPGHSGKLMLNFFRPLHIPRLANDEQKPSSDIQIGEVYKNTAGFLHDAKRTWQIFVPIPLRNVTSVLYDILTLKTRPQDLLNSDTEHFRECLRVNVGNFTFQEAFDRTGRILNITGMCRNCKFYCYAHTNTRYQ